MKYKLIAFDIDGTLIDQNMQLRPETVEGLQYLINKGIHCSIITGRTLTDIINVFGKLDFKYFVGLNGSIIYNNTTGTTEYCNAIDKNHITSLIHSITSQAAVIFTPEQIYITRYADDYFARLYQQSLNPLSVTDLVNYSEVLSIQVICPDEQSAAVTKSTLIQQYGTALAIEDAGFNFIQITNHNIDKGNALKFIAEQSGIALEDTIAVGDSMTDLPMTKVAGLGVAIKNSPLAEHPSITTITTEDNDNNGALNYIINHLL